MLTVCLLLGCADLAMRRAALVGEGIVTEGSPDAVLFSVMHEQVAPEAAAAAAAATSPTAGVQPVRQQCTDKPNQHCQNAAI